MKTFIKNIIVITSLILCISCTDGSTDSTGNNITGGNDYVGTIVNVPAPQPSNLTLTFSTSGTDADEVTTPTLDPAQYCLSKEEVVGLQVCSVTPENLTISVTALYLRKCVDSEECLSDENSIELYNGDAIEIEVTQDGTSFPFEFDMSEYAEYDLKYLDMNVRYIEQMFPITNAAEAGKITESLQGKKYRICTTDDGSCSSDGLATSGSILVDIDENDEFGYMQADENGIYEVAEKPKTSYLPYTNTSYSSSNPQGEDKYRDGSTNLNLPIPLVASTEDTVNSTDLTSLNVEFTLEKSLMFRDGADVLFRLDDISEDPTYGQYHPYYDSGLSPVLPQATMLSY
jgi:hypothetical protein